ncbi:uncharacterized protein [Lolium perenne]|uniref:uncharacterized protein isoform X2 n=1 Tax=Lolium perenne TaxID=4522 RepID=UPI0021F61423|nr:uncharacterized protein LOC127322158 isoform X2 [Lolium perenne]
MGWNGSRRSGGGAGGRGRGRGPASPNDLQRERVAASLIDAAARLGLQATDAGTGWPPEMQFRFACTDGDLARAKAVVDAMDEAERESLASLRFTDLGPLHLAASSGDMAICKYLVEQLGFDVNSDASDHGSGVTPLHFAVSHEQVTAVRYFLEKGADPNIKDSSNGTASLHEAAALGYDEITQLLLANGANVDEPSTHGTPLVAAAAHGKFSSMKILLEHHADPNKVSWEYGTPLTTTLYATPDRMDESTCLKCVKLLVEAGADVKCTNPETPLAIATTNGLTKCAEYLLEVKTSEDRRKARLKSNGPKARLKSNGAKAVQENDYAAALKFYTEAIKLDPEDAVLYSNRSLCHLKCDEEYDALHDANACIRLKPDWNKGYYRKGAALMSLLEYKEASDAFLAGVKLKPENKEMEDAYWEAVEAMRKEQSEPSLYDLD